MPACRGGAVHLVLEGSGHDSFNDAVQLLAVHYRGAVDYLRSFKKVPCWLVGLHVVLMQSPNCTIGHMRPHSSFGGL